MAGIYAENFVVKLNYYDENFQFVDPVSAFELIEACLVRTHNLVLSFRTKHVAAERLLMTRKFSRPPNNRCGRNTKVVGIQERSCLQELELLG